jgi:hypothetical protein
MDMAIERTNSFHLMLSDDELSLLRMLAERDGLNASDYLRSLIRREAGGNSGDRMSRVRQLVELLAPEVDLRKAWEGQQALAQIPDRAPSNSTRAPKRTARRASKKSGC